jgi:hypothetical protein
MMSRRTQTRLKNNNNNNNATIIKKKEEKKENAGKMRNTGPKT